MISIENIKDKTTNLNVLYVEDDPSSRGQLAVILDMFFSSVTIAEDGLQGWELYNSHEFDLVITDITMPKMTGIDLIKRIKANNYMQKVIIISAHDNVENLLSAIREGVDDFILKPVEIDQLEGAIYKIATVIHNEKIENFYKEELEKEVERKTQELMQQAVTDKLTGLYNRSRLNMMLLRPGKKVIMMLNIDSFDNINTAYGYTTGDLIMKKIAEFLKQNLYPDSIIFRLGHDEFAFLFTSVKINEAEAYARELQHMIAQHPITYENIVVKFTATIALAEGEDDLLRDVHLAFNQARAIGRNRIAVYKYDPDIEKHQIEVQKYMHIIYDALEKKDIVPYFQAIVNNKTGRIEKYECLARIIYNDEVLQPDSFIETASLMGVLPDITRLMIEKSFEYFKDRTEQFSINISEHDLNEGYLDSFLEQNVIKYGINPSRVVLEVLEGISANGADKSLDQLLAFKDRGFQLAIDDFGAQNSNFERVHRLKVDYIKIDGSFIKNIDKDINSYYVAKTIADFSKSIGAKVVAEYVHSKETYDKVLEIGVDYSQGYYFSKPVRQIK